MQTNENNRSKNLQIEKFIDPVVEKMVSNVEWKDMQTSPLGKIIPGAELRSEAKKMLKSIIYDEQEQFRITRGVKLIEENLDRLPNAALCRADLRQAGEILLQQLEETVELLDQNAEVLNNMEKDLLVSMENAPSNDLNFENIPSTAELLKISPATMAAFYELGTLLFKEKRIEEALCIFLYLTTLNVYSYEIWFSLGLCYESLSEWIHAIYAYTMSSLMNPHYIPHYLRCIQCYLTVKDKENAIGSFQLAEHFMTPADKEAYGPQMLYLKQLCNSM